VEGGFGKEESVKFLPGYSRKRNLKGTQQRPM
jgi:hypothetical protein